MAARPPIDSVSMSLVYVGVLVLAPAAIAVRVGYLLYRMTRGTA